MAQPGAKSTPRPGCQAGSGGGRAASNAPPVICCALWTPIDCVPNLNQRQQFEAALPVGRCKRRRPPSLLCLVDAPAHTASPRTRPGARCRQVAAAVRPDCTLDPAACKPAHPPVLKTLLAGQTASAPDSCSSLAPVPNAPAPLPPSCCRWHGVPPRRRPAAPRGSGHTMLQPHSGRCRGLFRYAVHQRC